MISPLAQVRLRGRSRPSSSRINKRVRFSTRGKRRHWQRKSLFSPGERRAFAASPRLTEPAFWIWLDVQFVFVRFLFVQFRFEEAVGCLMFTRSAATGFLRCLPGFPFVFPVIL